MHVAVHDMLAGMPASKCTADLWEQLLAAVASAAASAGLRATP